MRYEEKPDFDGDDEAEEKWYEDKHLVDWKVWRTLETVDDLISEHGLEVVYYGEDAEGPFTIVKK